MVNLCRSDIVQSSGMYMNRFFLIPLALVDSCYDQSQSMSTNQVVGQGNESTPTLGSIRSTGSGSGSVRSNFPNGIKLQIARDARERCVVCLDYMGAMGDAGHIVSASERERRTEVFNPCYVQTKALNIRLGQLFHAGEANILSEPYSYSAAHNGIYCKGVQLTVSVSHMSC